MEQQRTIDGALLGLDQSPTPKKMNAETIWIVDRAEQLIVIVLNVWLVWRLAPSGFANIPIYSLLLIISEGTVLAFVIARRPTGNISIRPGDWLLGFGATIAPLLIVDSTPFLPLIGSQIMLVGWGVHCWAKLSLRRSFGVVAADRGVKTVGPYAIVRHPMYLGYIITHIGFLLAVPSVWNVFLYAFTWALFSARILAEERVLKKNPQYQVYAAKVSWRLIPFVW